MAFSNIEIELKHLNLTVRGIRYCPGKSKNKNNYHKILCLHGWLDNANSFHPLMPLLHNSDIIALDFPGHGHSEHCPDPYTIANNAHYVLQTAAALQWDNFHLIGHSMGGCIAPFATIASPDSIKSMVLIDAAGPMTETAEQLPERLVRFHRELTNHQTYRSRQFQNKEEAVASRLRATKMTASSARLIIDRQLQKTDNGYEWGFDGKLRVASASYFTEEQVQAVLSNLNCPVQCILAEDGYIVHKQQMMQRLNYINNVKIETLAGNHHLHMDSPVEVAAHINNFLLTTR